MWSTFAQCAQWHRLFVTPWTEPTSLSDHGIFQARVLEWVAMPFSRGSSQPRDITQSLTAHQCHLESPTFVQYFSAFSTHTFCSSKYSFDVGQILQLWFIDKKTEMGANHLPEATPIVSNPCGIRRNHASSINKFSSPSFSGLLKMFRP